jgi:uncharacterized protein YkuJ
MKKQANQNRSRERKRERNGSKLITVVFKREQYFVIE